MKVFYANENYAKYGYSGMNYFMALIMATIYIMITCFLIIIILFSLAPDLYKQYLIIGSKIPAIPFAIITIGGIFVLLRMTIKEEILVDTSFTKDKVNRAINYLIGYAFLVVVVAVLLGLKFLRHQRGQI
jgi:hypothetical protein